MSRKDDSHAGIHEDAPVSLLDSYALDRIRYKVRQLVRAFGLNDHDAEDLTSRMLLDVLRAARRYDATRSTPHTYVSRVLDRTYRYLRRELKNRRGRPASSPIRFSEIEQAGRSAICIECRLPNHVRCIDLRIDIQDALQAMPRLHQAICEDLKHFTPEEVAANLGVHRSTVYRHIVRIRATLESAGLG